MDQTIPPIKPAGNKFLSGSLIALTLAGVIIAWIDIIKQFYLFYGYEGTILKVKDCIVPNPVTTPCFYGGFGFILALIIAIKFYRQSPTKKASLWFTLYLLAGSIFAWTFAGKVIINFMTSDTSIGVKGCSGIVITNPFLTACFAGASLFLISFIISLILFLRKK